jgi:excisionase family DNA binding protein
MTLPAEKTLEREKVSSAFTFDRPFYDLRDTSTALGNCSRSTIYRLIEQRKLVRVNLGTKALITGESLARFIDELNVTA